MRTRQRTKPSSHARSTMLPTPASNCSSSIGLMSDFPVYALTDEHQAIREAVRAIAEAKIAPHAAEVDEEARYPVEAEKALIAADSHHPHEPEEYRRAGADE